MSVAEAFHVRLVLLRPIVVNTGGDVRIAAHAGVVEGLDFLVLFGTGHECFPLVRRIGCQAHAFVGLLEGARVDPLVERDVVVNKTMHVQERLHELDGVDQPFVKAW